MIDVRDDDHLGGHIRGAKWEPSEGLRKDKVEALVDEYHNDLDVVVFHCMLRLVMVLFVVC